MSTESKPKRIRTAAIVQDVVQGYVAGLQEALFNLSNLTLDGFRATIEDLSPKQGVTSPKMAKILEAISKVQGTAVALATAHEIRARLESAKEQVKNEPEQLGLIRDKGNEGESP